MGIDYLLMSEKDEHLSVFLDVVFVRSEQRRSMDISPLFLSFGFWGLCGSFIQNISFVLIVSDRWRPACLITIGRLVWMK